MQYIEHTFYCTQSEFNALTDDLTKKFVECTFVLDSTTVQKQIEYIQDTQNMTNCRKIYKTPSTNASTATKLLNPVTINGVQFDGSQNINVYSVIPQGPLGNVMVSDGTQWTSKSKTETGIQQIFNGVVDITKFTASHSPTTRQFSITYSPGAAFHVKGNYFIVNSTQNPITVQTSAHANITGSYYCYFDQNGNLIVSNQIWDISITAPLYGVYYTTNNNGTGPASILQLETHPGLYGMPDSTRKYLHTTLGTQLCSGCVITQGTGITWSTTQGVIMDEDLNSIVSAAPSSSNYRMAWLTGTTSSPTWNWIDVAQQGLYTNGTDPYYNQLNGSTWQLTPITTNGGYFNQWIIATNSYNNPQIVILLGQQTYNTLSEAQTATFSSSMQNLALFMTESVILYKIIYRRRNTNPVEQYYSDIQQITKVQESIVSIGTQSVVKQNVQQTYLTDGKYHLDDNAYKLLTNTSDFQDVFYLTVQNPGKYNVSYSMEYYNNKAYPPEIYSIVSVNGVQILPLRSYAIGSGNTLVNSFALDLNVGDVVKTQIKIAFLGSFTLFKVNNGNLQIIQILQ